MRHSNFTDYSLRVLMYCAANKDRLVTISEIAKFHKISNNHLLKVVSNLRKLGYLCSTRGRNGGLSLSRPPKDIRIDEVVKSTELDFHLVECFNAQTNQCIISSNCKLQNTFRTALKAYLNVLSQTTLADIFSENQKKQTINIIKKR